MQLLPLCCTVPHPFSFFAKGWVPVASRNKFRPAKRTAVGPEVLERAAHLTRAFCNSPVVWILRVTPVNSKIWQHSHTFDPFFSGFCRRKGEWGPVLNSKPRPNFGQAKVIKPRNEDAAFPEKSEKMSESLQSSGLERRTLRPRGSWA
jgi:hypothetical protein